LTVERERLVVFARAPRLGLVKTRLTPGLAPEEALALHQAFVDDAVERLGRLSRPGLDRILYWTEPSSDAPPHGWSFRAQNGVDLGRRMARSVDDAIADRCARVVIVGTDSPTLPTRIVEEAFEALGRVDVVLGPAEDGGYYLVGCTRPLPEIFQNISWGTGAVLKETRERLVRASIPFELLPPWYDVDTPSDLERLRLEIDYLGEHDPNEVPRHAAAALSSLEDR